MSLILTAQIVASFLLDDDCDAHLLLLTLNRCMKRAYLGGDVGCGPLDDLAWTSYSRCVYMARTMFNRTISTRWISELHNYNSRLPHVVRVAKQARPDVERHLRVLVSNPKLSLPSGLRTSQPKSHARHRREVSTWLVWNHRFVQSELHYDTGQEPRKKKPRVCGTNVYLTLPTEIWNQVLDFLAPTPHDAIGLVDTSLEFRKVVRDHPLNLVFLHSYLLTHCSRPRYLQLTASSSYLSLLDRLNSSRMMLTELQGNAHSTYSNLIDNITTLPDTMVYQLDFIMLATYGIDTLAFMHPEVTARRTMLFGVSRHERQDASLECSYLYDQIRQNELDIRVRSRSVEATLLDSATIMLHNLTRFLDDLQTSIYACIGEEEGETFAGCLQKVTDSALRLTKTLAASNTTHDTWYQQVTTHMEQRLAVCVMCYAARMHLHPPSFTRGEDVSNWFNYMSRIYNTRSVRMRIAITPVNHSGECTAASLLFTFMHTSLIPVMCVTWSWGVWPPPNATPRTADLIIVMRGGVFWWYQTRAPRFEHAKSWLLESGARLRAVMINHGKIIGRCAPCGRVLQKSDTWIGSTCDTHLP